MTDREFSDFCALGGAIPPPPAYLALAKLCVVFARRLMAAKVPLIEGTWHVAHEERNPFRYWDESDPFTRSQYIRDAREFVLMAGYTGEWGKCVCMDEVGLKPERPKNSVYGASAYECQRCGGQGSG